MNITKSVFVLTLFFLSCLLCLPIWAFAQNPSPLTTAIQQIAQQVVMDSKTKLLQEVADSIQVTYLTSEFPRAAGQNEQIKTKITVKNTSGTIWKKEGLLSTYFTYTWLDSLGKPIPGADEGTVSLPYHIANDQLAVLALNTVTPEQYIGRAILQIKLVTLSSPLGQVDGIAPYQMKINIQKEKPKAPPIVTPSQPPVAVVDTSTVANGYLVTGRGFGHGVGLSQWGARGMALQGSTYEEIIPYYYQGTKIENNPTETPIRVGIHLNQSQATVKADTTYRIIDDTKKEVLFEGNANDQWKIQIQDGLVTATPVYLSLPQLPDNQQTLQSRKMILEPEGNLTLLEKNNGYRGALLFTTNAKNTLDVINRVDLEDYLLGVVAKEMSASFPKEALKAQAVAGRSYARYKMDQNQAKSFDVYPTETSQVYGGIKGETPQSTEAVMATKDKIATHNGKIIEAVFSANSGGHTENNENVWGTAPIPYLRGVLDEYSGYQADAIKDRYGFWWSKSYTKEQLTAIFAVGQLLSIDVTETYASGRPSVIQVTGLEKTKQYSSSEFRKLLDPNNQIFQSNWYEIKKVEPTK